MEQQPDQQFDIVLSKCSSNISYGSIPIIRMYSATSTDQDIYTKMHQKFLRTSEIYGTILVVAQKLVEKTSLDLDLVLLLLHKYKWNVDKLEEGYFSEEDQQEYLSKLSKKSVSHLDQEVGRCGICLENQVLIASICGHSACVGCWRQYLTIECMEKAFFKCMNQSCGTLLYHSFVMKILQVKNKYLKRLSLEYAREVKTISACPGVDCELFFQDTSLLVKSVLCECRTRYCFKCQAEPHQPCQCRDVVNWYELTKSEKPNEAWIKSHTKLCPGCKNPIQRALGCNLIACMCGVQFCYMCCKIWDQDHKDHFKCPVELTKKKSLQQDTLNITLQYSKFIISSSIQKNVEKEFVESDTLCKQVSKKLQIPENDTAFIKLLCDLIVRGHSYIKWTEVLEYHRQRVFGHSNFLTPNLEKLKTEIHKCGVLLLNLKSKTTKVLEEEKSQFLSVQGATIKEFYREKEHIQKYIKQTDLFISGFLGDVPYM